MSETPANPSPQPTIVEKIQQAAEVNRLNSTDSKDQKSDQVDAKNHSKRNYVILKLFLLLILCSIIAYGYWFYFVQFHETTDDAYVNGNAVKLMCPQNGTVVSIYADNTNYVKQGQLLIELDRTIYQLAFDKAKVDLALATRQVKQQWENLQERKASVQLQEAELKRTQEDYKSRLALKDTLAISKEDFTHARANFEVAQASVNVAKHQLDSAIATLGQTPLEDHPLIQNAKIALLEAYVNLMRCKILAPTDGYIAQRNVQVGEWITPTRALMSIIPLNQIWVDANFKETQLSDIRIGQPVKLSSDLYGSDVMYEGKIQGIVTGTGSVFSLLPPQNATGNWIKIVQRVPVRILLDAKEVQKQPLFLGLSMYVDVDTTNQTGLRLIEHTVDASQFSTFVFDIDKQPAEHLIQEIIHTNLSSTSLSSASKDK